MPEGEGFRAKDSRGIERGRQLLINTSRGSRQQQVAEAAAEGAQQRQQAAAGGRDSISSSAAEAACARSGHTSRHSCPAPAAAAAAVAKWIELPAVAAVAEAVAGLEGAQAGSRMPTCCWHKTEPRCKPELSVLGDQVPPSHPHRDAAGTLHARCMDQREYCRLSSRRCRIPACACVPVRAGCGGCLPQRSSTGWSCVCPDVAKGRPTRCPPP